MTEKLKKNKWIIIPIILVIILIIILLCFLNNKKELPFVEKNNIEILSFDKEYQNPVYFYATDSDDNEITIDGLTFEDSNALYKFYDYNVSDSDGDTIYSFKYDFEVPLNCTLNGYVSYLQYTYSIVLPVFFDYYTGEEYLVKKITIDENNIAHYNVSPFDSEEEYKDPYKYTEVTWDGKTSKIGVRVETSSKWDGVDIKTEDNKHIYKDTDRATATVYIKTPKDYDGVMIAIFKNGVSKESHELQHKKYLRYIELISDYANSKEKSEELIKIEESYTKVYILFDSQYDENKKYTKDDFYVIRPGVTK